MALIVKSKVPGPIQYAPTWRFKIPNQLPRTLAQGIHRPPPEQSLAALSMSASSELTDAAHDFPPNTCWVLVKDGSLGLVGNTLPKPVLISTPMAGGLSLPHGSIEHLK